MSMPMLKHTRKLRRTANAFAEEMMPRLIPDDAIKYHGKPTNGTNNPRKAMNGLSS